VIVSKEANEKASFHPYDHFFTWNEDHVIKN